MGMWENLEQSSLDCLSAIQTIRFAVLFIQPVDLCRMTDRTVTLYSSEVSESAPVQLSFGLADNFVPCACYSNEKQQKQKTYAGPIG